MIVIKNTTVMDGIDGLLEIATGEKGIKFKDFVDKFNEAAKNQKKYTDKISSLTDKLVKAESASMPTGVDLVNSEELTYELVLKLASDVFEGSTKAGKAVKIEDLNFTIPTLVWKDKAGTVVKHPESPEVDENYQFTAMNLLKFLTAFSKGMNPWLYGHTGTGKSTFVEQIATRLGFPVSRVNLDANLERADLVGHVGLEEKAGATVSVYKEGILPRAMQRPGFLLLDEIDAGRPDILFVIQRALEGSGLMLTEDHGRIVKAHPLFRFVATANTRGQGDEYGIYPGTRSLNTSLIDRFPVFIEFKYLVKEAETKLLKAKYPDLDDTLLEQVILFANEQRKAFANGEMMQPITPRGLQTLAEAYLHFCDAGVAKLGLPMDLALEMTIFDKTTKDTLQKTKELADRCLKKAA